MAARVRAAVPGAPPRRRPSLRRLDASTRWDARRAPLPPQVSLGERQLTCSLGVRNAGEERFAFTAALAPHLGVSDAWDDAVSILGLTGSAYLDNLAHPEKPRVRLQTGPVVRIKQPTEHVYVNTQPRVALEARARARGRMSACRALAELACDTARDEPWRAAAAGQVGTGCTVFVENTQGFTDHVVRHIRARTAR